MAIDVSLLIDPNKYDRIDTASNQHHILESAQNAALRSVVALAEGALTLSGPGTFRVVAGIAYFNDGSLSAAPWHALVPIYNEDGVLTFEINRVGVAPVAGAPATFRIFNGDAYIADPGAGATPWHKLIPFVNDDLSITFNIDPTGVA